MKAMSKAELELEKLISKLEGQLASAHYALSLLRDKHSEGAQRSASPDIKSSVPAMMERSAEEIPMFS